MTTPGEYFQYRVPSKFIGEIQIVFAIIVLVSGIVSLVAFYSSLSSAVGHEKDMVVGYITFSILTIIVSITDVAFALVLISATEKISLGRCIIWRGYSACLLGLFGLLTIAFATMMRTASVILGFVPTLIFKPFALWVVSGFIDELRQLENFPASQIANFPPGKPRLTLQNPRQLKKTTVIFKRESVIGSKITSIPEED